MKIGVYGGSFNPPHKGHINLADTAVRELGLDKLCIMPVGDPWYKDDSNLAAGNYRIRMCDLAFNTNEKAVISDWEIKSKERNYTVSTIHRIRSEYPDAEIYLIMGSDMFLTLENWFKFTELRDMVTFVTAARLKEIDDEIVKYKSYLEAKGAKTEILDIDVMPVNSTQIRENLSQKGEDENITSEVLEYIKQNGLYGFDENAYTYPLEKFREIVKKSVDEKRYIHSINVAESAVYLAEKYGYNPHIAKAAGLLHDVCKRMDVDKQVEIIRKSRIKWDEITYSQTKILHGLTAAEYIFNEMGVYNEDIINSVRYHTTGRPDMSLLEKIVYTADLISVERDYPDVDYVRKLADECLDMAVAYVCEYNLEKLFKSKNPISQITVETYNYYSVKK